MYPRPTRSTPTDTLLPYATLFRSGPGRRLKIMAKKQTRIPLMAGNWKMNLNHQEAVVLVQKLAWTLSDKRHDYDKVEVVVIPPFTDLRSVQTMVDGDRLKIRYGAQDVSTQDSGAFTGEISAGMLAKDRKSTRLNSSH